MTDNTMEQENTRERPLQTFLQMLEFMHFLAQEDEEATLQKVRGYIETAYPNDEKWLSMLVEYGYFVSRSFTLPILEEYKKSELQEEEEEVQENYEKLSKVIEIRDLINRGIFNTAFDKLWDFIENNFKENTDIKSKFYNLQRVFTNVAIPLPQNFHQQMDTFAGSLTR
jgi:hypothetical protein